MVHPQNYDSHVLGLLLIGAPAAGLPIIVVDAKKFNGKAPLNLQTPHFLQALLHMGCCQSLFIAQQFSIVA